MITKYDLDSAIAECQGRKEPDARTCIMLASFYTIRREMFGDDEKMQHPSYSYTPAPDDTVHIDSGSEFATAVNGRRLSEILPVIDELVDTLSIINPRLYSAFMDKLS